MSAERITRKEIKYRLNAQTHPAVLAEMEKHLTRDKFFFERIHNIYYDNDSDELIRISIQKPNVPFKEKIRLRTYEYEGELFPYVFIELKKKYKGIVYKRREKMTLEDAEKLLSGADPADILKPSQITDEILYFIKKTSIYPKLCLSYDRYSYKGKDDDLRITFDTMIQSRTEDLAFRSGKDDLPLLDSGECILEIKTGTAYPLWLTDILSKYKVYPESFSKYGGIYSQRLALKAKKE